MTPAGSRPTPAQFVGIAGGEPFDPRTWSGSARGLFAALERAKRLYAACTAEPTAAQVLRAKVASFHPHRDTWRGLFHSSVGMARDRSARARRALELLDASQFQAVLQLGPYVGRSEKLTVSYHDDDLAAAIGKDTRYRGIAAPQAKEMLQYETRTYRSMDRVFTMSEWAADAMARAHQLDRTRFEVVGAGSNIEEEMLRGERDYEQCHLLFVGRDFERKGGRDVLAAFKILRRNIPTARLTVVGADAGMADIDRVQFIGKVPLGSGDAKERMAAMYRSASAFVMPSRYEPFGIAFLEAMAAGLPCIGTSQCAMPEIIGDSGRVVPVGDIDALARAMFDVLSNPAITMQLGHRARERYQNAYGWDLVASRICAAADAMS